MLKRVKLIFVSITIVLMLSGCQEIDGAGNDTKKNKVEIEKNVDLAEVYAPSEVYIYSAVSWKEEYKKIIDVCLGGIYDEKESFAQSEQYRLAPGSKNEKLLNIFDGGKSFYGSKKNEMEAGVAFGYTNLRFDKLFPEYEKFSDEYRISGEIYSKDFDKKDAAFIAAKEEITDYLKLLNMNYYAVDDAVMLEGKDKKKEGWLIYWRQIIDNIPVSSVRLDAQAELIGTSVYNSGLSYNTHMKQRDSTLDTQFIDGKLTDWYNHDVIVLSEKLKECPVISVSEAYKKVESRYENYVIDSDCHMPVLEKAELQYKYIGIDEKNYLYPIWTFAVRTEELYQSQDGSVNTEEKWNYYLIDAVSGDYFTGNEIGGLKG